MAKALASMTLVSALGLALGFITLNWLTNCQTWDREQWTSESSCVLSLDLWHAATGG